MFAELQARFLVQASMLSSQTGTKYPQRYVEHSLELDLDTLCIHCL